MAIDDERLMAYADGALAPEDAAEVERMIAADAGLAAKVAAFSDSRALVKQALGVAPPVPDRLAATIRAMAEADARRQAPGGTAQVIDLASRRRTVPFWQLPIAASVALAVGILGGWIGKPESGGAGGLSVALIEEGALVDALASVTSGERREIGSGVGFTGIASFRDGSGQLCREFEHDRAQGDTVVAVACHAEAGWSVRFAVATAAADDAAYVPASSLDTLDAWLTANEAGAPLSDDEEAAALAALK
ncbi:anti-sigma factor family protein [Tabrizicola aquatica]|uniref:anti-sigma factor family protein n=1 Tax=Tabrizicola aquatica TaxID=909926 RepID=UPI000CD1F82D|nr:anti-sigma factor [Tabrizicola aquatica]